MSWTETEKYDADEKYGPAMEIRDLAQARSYLTLCIDHCMKFGRKTEVEARKIEVANIWYWSKYYNEETSRRVMRLFPPP
jgi:hypothetical protein